MIKSVLVTGGAGYIGSHVTLALMQSQIEVLILDNLCNASVEALSRLGQLAGRKPLFIQGDIRDRPLLDRLFVDHSIDAVLHFAGLKRVGESVSQPLLYYNNNVHGSEVLLQAMADANIFNFVFSSSATVYGELSQSPISEISPASQPTNPYGRSKLMVESILCDLAKSDPRWNVSILRYFNPVGAHESGLIGEDSNGVPCNLLPYISQVAIGKLPELVVFGKDYPTHDGTGVRDYIHVMDLAEGHLCALKALKTRAGVNIWNLGTGKGYSVMDIVRTFERVSGKVVPYRISSRRPGDVAACFADPTKAEHELNWRARRSLEDMLYDTWYWQTQNPDGYKKIN